MCNYTITRLSYLPIFTFLFASGLCTGGLVGLTLNLIARDTVGILGSAFIGLLSGMLSGLFGLIFTAIFNILAPYNGGLSLQLKTLMITDSSSSAEKEESSAIQTADPPD